MKGFTENDMILIGKLAEMNCFITLGVHTAKVISENEVLYSFLIEQDIPLSDSLLKEVARLKNIWEVGSKHYWLFMCMRTWFTKATYYQPIAEVKEAESCFGNMTGLWFMNPFPNNRSFFEFNPFDAEQTLQKELDDTINKAIDKSPQMTPNCIPTPIWELLQETSKSATTTTEQIKNNRIKNAIQNLKNELDNYTKGN